MRIELEAAEIKALAAEVAVHVNQTMMKRVDELEATLKNNGSISHHHGIGYWRMQYMQQEMGASGVELLQSIKSALDPNGILNRGKLIGYGI